MTRQVINKGITKNILNALKNETLPEAFDTDDVRSAIGEVFGADGIRRALNQLTNSGTLIREGTRSDPVFRWNKPKRGSDIVADLRRAIKNADPVLERAERLLKAIEGEPSA